ncbi:LacI family DNA-binding transcriptional regulator [Sphingomonas hylomeconis]|uniref:LacI family DNA-binding transcriptional regulator n=1 Tax=Sphingomonas hylomeconis TaxID=1395958 RepID=UPI0021BB3BFC|nr:LacI family DNA-binding transcriptional regulator [Sphingomonas hylomeconis]
MPAIPRFRAKPRISYALWPVWPSALVAASQYGVRVIRFGRQGLKNGRQGERSGRSHARATIADVAELAGVSAMTVSNVLNRRPKAGADARAAVQAAVEQLGYVPNREAKRLAGAQTLRVGIFYTDAATAFVGTVLVGALNASVPMGAEIIVEPADPADPDALRASLLRLQRSGVNGVLLPPPIAELVAMSGWLSEIDLPAVAVSPGASLPGLPSARCDEQHAAYDITRLLIARGHRRIGIVGGPEGHSAAATRLEGYRCAMAEGGLPVDREFIAPGDFTFQGGQKAAARLLALPAPVDAIFATNDASACGVLATAHQLGIAVPEDLSVVGYDDTPVAQQVWPALTTVRQDTTAMGKIAMTLLADLIAARSTGSAAPLDRLVPYSVIERGSIRPA